MKRGVSADMCRGVRQNGRNQTSLVLRRDRSVAPLPKGKIDNSFVDNRVAHPGKDQPFREEGRAEMDGGHTRPVEDAFGDPVIACVRRSSDRVLRGSWNPPAQRSATC